ncbi:hypothetical protein LY76DRAFT_211889 [Colletotrichum caudatum]|nr:hypothetical protein LY76DRAFT_211889 [Colletotrichum caudatum]
MNQWAEGGGCYGATFAAERLKGPPEQLRISPASPVSFSPTAPIMSTTSVSTGGGRKTEGNTGFGSPCSVLPGVMMAHASTEGLSGRVPTCLPTPSLPRRRKNRSKTRISLGGREGGNGCGTSVVSPIPPALPPSSPRRRPKSSCQTGSVRPHRNRRSRLTGIMSSPNVLTPI